MVTQSVKRNGLEDASRRFNRFMGGLAARKRQVDRTLDMVKKDLDKTFTVFPKALAQEVEEEIKREGVLARIIARRWKAQAQHMGGSPRWTPLSPKYLEWKRRHGFSTRILVRTGALKAAAIDVARKVYRFGEEPAWKAKDTGLDYAEYVEQGGRAPARPFFRPLDHEEKQYLRKAEMKAARRVLRRYLGRG